MALARGGRWPDVAAVLLAATVALAACAPPPGDAPSGDAPTEDATELTPVTDGGATVTIVNESATDLTVTIGHPEGGPDELRDVPVPAGEERELRLMLPAGACTEDRVSAAVAEPEAGESGRLAVHPPELCDGYVWTIRDEDVTGGPVLDA